MSRFITNPKFKKAHLQCAELSIPLGASLTCWQVISYVPGGTDTVNREEAKN